MDSAIQQANTFMNKLKNLDMSRAKIPSFPDRVFPVATLSNGQQLMSDGKTRVSFPAKRMIKEQNAIKKTGGSKLPSMFGANKTSPVNQLEESLAMSVALPETRLGKGKIDQSAFAQYLQNQLKDSILGGLQVPGMGKNPFMPGVGAKFSQTQALANLPQMKKGMETSVDKIMNQVRGRAKGLNQSKFAQDFLRRYNKPGEQQVPRSQRSTNLPFIAGYKSRYGLPAQQNAQYAKLDSANIKGRAII